jgi:hypothetical protein
MRACLLVISIVLGAAAVPAAAQPGLPPNDDLANAHDLGNGTTAAASGSNLWATAEAGEPERRSGPAAASVWYRWTAPQDGVARIETCGSDFDTTLAVFRGSAVRDLARVTANDDWCDGQSVVRFVAVAGTTYAIGVDGFRGDQGSVELAIRYLDRPPNDDFAAAADLGGGATAAAAGTNRDATLEAREPKHHRTKSPASVWYRWTAPATRRMRLDTCGSDFDTVLAVYAGSALDELGLVGANDDRCGASSVVRFRAVAGTTYHVAVAGYRRAEGSFALNLAPRRTRR